MLIKKNQKNVKKTLFILLGFYSHNHWVWITCSWSRTTCAPYSSRALLEVAMWWGLSTSSKNKRAYPYRQTGVSWVKRGIPSADERGHLLLQESDSPIIWDFLTGPARVSSK
jgi:hypothetical protein